MAKKGSALAGVEGCHSQHTPKGRTFRVSGSSVNGKAGLAEIFCWPCQARTAVCVTEGLPAIRLRAR